MSLLQTNSGYKAWLSQLKNKFRGSQLKAALTVNHELLHFYWELGADILDKQISTQWGDGFLAQLSADLMAEFPDVKGFSRRNLEQIRQWVRFWTSSQSIAKQPVSQLAAIPWGHNLAILKKCKDPAEALYYVKNTVVHGWSRSVLVHQIESGLFHREGKAVTNFSENLPSAQSELANQTLKDPYVFDFLSMTKNYTERDKLVAEYALSDIHKPIGISEYLLTHVLPKSLKSSLPSIEEIEAELSRDLGGDVTP